MKSFCFGRFRFDVQRQELFRDGEAVHLTPKAMELLELLLERSGRVVSHDELVDILWPDVSVSDASLKNLVSTVRNALDDHERDGKFIRNIHGRGYIFNGEVEHSTSIDDRCCRGYLVIDDRSFVLPTGTSLIGREPDCTVVLPYSNVSRHHARLELYANRATLEDLGSRNGTFVDSVRIADRVSLGRGHEISFGGVLALFKCEPPSASTLTPSSW